MSIPDVAPRPRAPSRGARRAGRPRVVLDLVPIHPGHGGTGGGIWSYASHLARELDALAPDDLEIVCLTHPGQPLELRRIRQERLPVDTRSVVRRLAWVHVGLPAWCARHDVAVLHKLATEIPAAIPGVRVVATVQDFMAEFFRESLPAYPGPRPSALHGAYFTLATRRCFARSDVVLTTTQTIAAEARRRHARARAPIAVVPLGVVPIAAPAPRRRTPPSPADPFRVRYVGTFSPYKGQLNGARAIARFAERHPALLPAISLAFRGFVGDRAYHAAVRGAVADGAARERVRFVPYDPAADVRDVFADADALLLLSEYEGFGLPPLEAQTAGVPVVCSDIAVFREVLGDGALFVPPGDADAAADALARLMTEPALRAELVRRGRANAERFSWARTARETLDVYRALAGRRA